MLEIMEQHHRDGRSGIYSACSANSYVLEAALEMGKATNTAVLIEATANQCNQFGGYTGMKPQDFADFVFQIADRVGFPKDMLILGGDHLGPLTWQSEPESEAMEKSMELLRQYVLAGFTKIHIDTSMRLKGDPEKLTDALIAKRAAVLATVAEAAFAERQKTHPNAPAPVYVIGSEVPIPGGAQVEEESIHVTSPAEFAATCEAFHAAFREAGLDDAFKRVVGVVVQPGVEFGDEQIFAYSREAAKDLTDRLKDFAAIVFEGHSTDYQTRAQLREMVEDGIAILKVGPALTFYFREALFALAAIEAELGLPNPSDFKNVLERVMCQNPDNWKKHYHGSEEELAYKRKYSFLDRSRYYFADEAVQASLKKLLENINSNPIPKTTLSQYLPTAYTRLHRAGAAYSAENLIKARVKDCIEDYLYAIRVYP